MTTAGDIEAQAADWLIKQDGGLMTEALRAEFDAWLAADPRARAAYVRLETAWKNADNLRRLRPLDGSVDEDLLARSPFTPIPIDEYPASEETRAASPVATSDATEEVLRPRARGWLLGFAITATVAALGLGAMLWHTQQKSDWHVYRTDRGDLSKIVLADGSIINLNTNSELRVRLTPDLRRIVLARGEALFKVAHDRDRPFDVQANDTMVRAVGTEFSVRVRDSAEGRDGHQNVEVLVKEGRVAIGSADTRQQRDQPALPTAPKTMLAAGETAFIEETQAIEVQKVAEADVERKLSWTEGRLWFERQTLKDVVAEFNRYNRRQMVIGDPTLEDLRIGGGFEATDPESFIAALEPTLGVRGVPGSDEVIRLVRTEKKNTR